ncbi:MAG: hypothetical protein EA428_06835 [Spirochaetaceae bacterium]|nr:MAG: hypothetical protein EA428_06835 [Spirochaetaceae bacterium]
MENALNVLGRKAGFNAALRHFRIVNAFMGDMQKGLNLADLLATAIDEGKIARHQVPLALSALLVDRFEYAYVAHNMEKSIDGVENLSERVAQWTALQVVVAYHHPQAGLFVLNPKDMAGWDQAVPLMNDELVVVYVGPARAGADIPPKVLGTAAEDVLKLLYGKAVKDKKDYVATSAGAAAVKPRVRGAGGFSDDSSTESGSTAEPAKQDQGGAPARPQSSGRRMTPRYSVIVSNELFHNGNVEAWKRIVESYKAKYPGLDVLIWYENERINDINALFKWGKVKHGMPIMVSVVGDEIKDVSKLQRYLYEGASPRFEVFLRGGVDRILDLF